MNILVLSAALIALPREGNLASILTLFPYNGRSHQMVFDPLLRRLAQRGHHVTVVSFFPIENPPINYTSVSLENITAPALESVDLNRYESSNRIVKAFSIDKLMLTLGRHVALDVCTKLVQFEPLAEVLKKKYDVVLVENFNSDCVLGLVHMYGLRAPIVMLLASAMTPWSAPRVGVSDNPSYVPIRNSEYSAKMTFIQRLENTFFNMYYKLWYRYTVQLKEERVIERQFGRPMPDLQELANKVSLVLVNVFHSLNGVRPLLPGVVEVGGMHLDSVKNSIPPLIETFLKESVHGVVLVSFGSLIKTCTIPKHREETIIKVFSKLRHRVIWKFENSSDHGILQGNILKVRWLPQYELLQHEKVIAFIGHGGLLGMTEAISAGKPMLVVPFFGDQFNNAIHAQDVGLGRMLPYTQLTENSLEEALQIVLSDKMRLTAQRASAIWRDRQNKPMDTAIYSIERLIRWGSQDPLHSVSRDMPFYQYLLIDVGVVLISLLVLLITFVGIILNFVFSFLNVKTKTKFKLR